VAPLTRVTQALRAQSRPGGVIRNGFLDPVAAGLGVVQTDVEGGVRKLQGLDASDAGVAASEWAGVDELTALPESLSSDQPAGLPALRSQGFMLAFKDQAKRLQDAFKAAKGLDTHLIEPPVKKSLLTKTAGWKGEAISGATVLFAEDLTRGFRVDVQDLDAKVGAGTWRSLHRRHETYEIGTMKWTPVGETEGTVRGSLTRAGLGDKVSPVYVAHPALAVWTGWSLSVPHPAKVVGSELGATGDGPDLLEPANPAPEFGLSVKYDKATGLPSLRYGRRYRFRARAVDLAGDSVPFDAASPDDLGTKPETYDRFDPLEPPVPTFIDGAANLPEAGESMERLAIRTYREPAAGPAPVARRRLFPPRAAVDQAERHGALDIAEGRIDGSLRETLASKDHKDAALPLQEVPLEAIVSGGIKIKAGELREQRSVPEDLIETPYLPDPTTSRWRVAIEPVRAGGLSWKGEVAVEGVGGQADEVWPRWKGVEVRLEAGPANVVTSGSLITVTLPPGDAVRMTLAVKPPEPETFGVWRWAQARKANALAGALVAAKAGDHWMLTPDRTLELIHAVQVPVVAPTFGEPGAEGPAVRVGREPGQKEARLAFTCRTHLNSSRQIEVGATWDEPFDVVTARPGPGQPYAAPVVKAFAAHSFSRPILDKDYLDGETTAAWLDGLPESTRALPVSELQSFPDTRARHVTLTVSTASRYREYMPPTLRTDTATGAESVTAIVAAEKATAWIPSASRPPAPVIISVNPTFAWDRKAEAGAAEQSSRRLGGGFRVWLDRPWFVTGFNEMLAVCLVIPAGMGEALFKAIGGTALGESDAKRLGSRWALDPLFVGEGVTGEAPNEFPRQVRRPSEVSKQPACFDKPEFSAFKTAFDALPDAALRTLVTAPGAPGSQLFISPHLVDWDADRGLWFCDIELDSGDAYMPFVQLALARYQPMSVARHPPITMPEGLTGGSPADAVATLDPEQSNAEDLHLSAPVLTDFLQILPERHTTISQGEGFVDVTVRGVSAKFEGRTPSRFRLRLANAVSTDPDVQDLGEIVEPEAIPTLGPIDLDGVQASVDLAQVSEIVSGGFTAAPGPVTAHGPGTGGPVGVKSLPLLFSGRITAGKLKGRRLIVEELESWPTEVFDQAQQFPPGVEPEGRLVYLDQFDL